MKIKLFFLIVLLGVLTTGLFAEEALNAISGLALPPYILSENSGMEYEIVQAALGEEGYSFSLKLVQFIRVRVNMESGDADMAFPTNEDSGLRNVYFSDNHINYKNVVVSLKSSNLKINSVADLADLSIIAFQDANLYLGEEYKKMSENNSNYSEMAAQESQVAMLFAGRTDVVVMDENIFKYFRQNSELVDTSAEVVFHEIFDETLYRVAFNDENVRDAFNRGLQKIRKDGTYDKIINSYIK